MLFKLCKLQGAAHKGAWEVDQEWINSVLKWCPYKLFNNLFCQSVSLCLYIKKLWMNSWYLNIGGTKTICPFLAETPWPAGTPGWPGTLTSAWWWDQPARPTAETDISHSTSCSSSPCSSGCSTALSLCPTCTTAQSSGPPWCSLLYNVLLFIEIC